MCAKHDWRHRGRESVCVACGATVDRPEEHTNRPRRLKAKSWQRERKKMLARVGK